MYSIFVSTYFRVLKLNVLEIFLHEKTTHRYAFGHSNKKFSKFITNSDVMCSIYKVEICSLIVLAIYVTKQTLADEQIAFY